MSFCLLLFFLIIVENTKGYTKLVTPHADSFLASLKPSDVTGT